MLNNKLALDKNNMHYEDIWRNVTKDLNKHYGEALYRSWFSKIRFLEFSGNSILLATPTNFIRDWIKSNYSSFILELWQHYDKEVKSIEMITKKPTEEIKIVADNS